MKCECNGPQGKAEEKRAIRDREGFSWIASASLGLALAFLGSFPQLASAQTPSVATDLADYAPGATAQITGSGFWPNEIVTLQVTHADGTPDGGAGHEPWTVTAGPLGSFTTSWYVDPDDSLGSTFLLTAVGRDSGLTAETTFTDAPPPDLQQLWQCDPPNGYDPSTYDCAASPGWVFGNNDGLFFEGDTVPYRTRMQNLDSGNDYSITIQWDTSQSSKHALDYLKSFNATIPNALPCFGLSGLPSGLCSGLPSTLAIPPDTDMQADAAWIANAGVQDPGVFTMFGGTITSTSVYTTPGSYAGNTKTSITVFFTANSTDIVMAWGGHIAERDDWGLDNSAAAISGSPYHMRILSWRDETNNDDLNVGNTDRSLSADAVIFPASITIIKEATPQGSTVFECTASPSPLTNFSLVDDGTSANTKVFSDITNFTTYTVTEIVPLGWALLSEGGIVCSVTSPNGGSQDVTSPPSVLIDLKEGENVTCTFFNQQLCPICPADGVCGSYTCDATTNFQCVATFLTTECRAAAGVCDVAENCPGNSVDCPTTDAKEPSTTECRGDQGLCDVPESCDGTSNDCPADAKEPSTTECRGDQGLCDVPESCDGSSNDCPADAKEPATTECRGDQGLCDVPESCDGSSNDCPADAKEPATTECRGDQGLCDVPESCDGESNDCPADAKEPSTTICREAAGVCDVEESCDGTSNDCPTDEVEPATTECRADTGVCDVRELCTGNSVACPADLKEECALVTDSSLCIFDRGDECGLDTKQFNLNFTPAVDAPWPGYKANSTNPGQFYFNGFVPGDEGFTEVVIFTVPWPFVSQGAQPVHIYDGTAVTLNGCVDLHDTPALAACPATISASDWATGVSMRTGVCSDGVTTWEVNCEMVTMALPNTGGYTCTVEIGFFTPASELVYVNMHLDYGLKGHNTDMNPMDGMADRYDAGANVTTGGYDALQNNATQNGPVAVADCTPYQFTQDNGGTFSDTVYNRNAFKKIAGAMGNVQTSSNGNGLAGLPVSLFRNSTGAIVASGYTDLDGYYLLNYKHTGKAESFTVIIGSGPSAVWKVVQLKANAWAEVSYDATTGTWFIQVK